ncbi:MAG: bifunctional phosphoribosyl-AMP cyclohydrolase/phosphoribosyl-ATP diphosphatase HisIE [Pyrinomonadaceae bacterium]
MRLRIEDLKFDTEGLIPAVVQDASNHEVLMLAYMNAESLRRTCDTNQTWFWSRSRKELWHKGETSENTQQVIDIRVDCDADAIIVLVDPAGPACHTGKQTCFHNHLAVKNTSTEVSVAMARPQTGTSQFDSLLDDLYSLIDSRYHERPEGSYTTYLFNKGREKILAKVSEEAGETVTAGREESDQRLTEETSDLIYHLLVLLVERGITLDRIRAELAGRRARNTNGE